MKKIIIIFLKVLKWFNCWQSFLSLCFVGFINSYNKNFLFILLENEYEEYYPNEYHYVFFGYILMIFLGAIHHSKIKNSFNVGPEYISFLEMIKLPISFYQKLMMILVVIPFLGMIYKWIYLMIWIFLVLIPLRFFGFDFF